MNMVLVYFYFIVTNKRYWIACSQ